MSFEKWICTHCGAINPNRSYECHNCRNNGNYERIVIQGQRNMTTLDRLIELADKAHPDWSARCREFSNTERPRHIWSDPYGWIGEFKDVCDAEFVESANPDTVKRLCELVKECKEWILRHHEMPGYSELLLKIEQLEKGSGE